LRQIKAIQVETLEALYPALDKLARKSYVDRALRRAMGFRPAKSHPSSVGALDPPCDFCAPLAG
jgi:hypothetical protein